MNMILYIFTIIDSNVGTDKQHGLPCIFFFFSLFLSLFPLFLSLVSLFSLFFSSFPVSFFCFCILASPPRIQPDCFIIVIIIIIITGRHDSA